MPTLIRLDRGQFHEVEDVWTEVADEDRQPSGEGAIILSAARLDGDEHFGARPLGVRLTVEDRVECVTARLNRVSLVALEFPKFRDGRALTAARLLRERYNFSGEIRAVGEVLREQAFFMVRCGFDAFVPADGSTAEQWAARALGHRHVYTRASDGRTPAYAEPLRLEEARDGL